MTMPAPPRGWRLGAPWGVPIHVSATWPLLFVFVVVWLGPQLGRTAGIGRGGYLVAAAYAVLLLVSVLAHEGAHALVARATGARVGHIVVDVFGGHTVYEGSRLTPGRAALVAVAGPLANAAAAVLGWALLQVLPPGVPWLLGFAFVATNAVVGAFNLVPGHPLDGGHLLDALVWRISGRRDLGLTVSGWAGRILVAVLVGWFVLRPILGGHRPSFVAIAWLALIGAMLWSGASHAVRAGRRMRAYARVDLESLLRPVTLVTGMSATPPPADAPVDGEGRGSVVVVDAPDGARWYDPAAGESAPLARPLPPRWLVDVGTRPELSDVVDHMHAHEVPLVVLRGPWGLRAVTAADTTAALSRAGVGSGRRRRTT